MEYIYRTNWFSLTGGQMKLLTDILEKHRPESICELGAGVSTDVFEQYCDNYGGKLLTIEHDRKYKHKDTVLLSLREHTALAIGAYRFGDVNAYEGLPLSLLTPDSVLRLPE